MDVVLRIDAEQQFFLGAGAFSFGQCSSLRKISFETWRGSVSAGYAITWDDLVTVALGAAVGSTFVDW